MRASNSLSTTCTRSVAAAAALTLATLACNLPGAGPTATPAPPRPTATLPIVASPTMARSPTVEITDQSEAILILEPGPGSRLTSPLRVVGIADSTFEQALGMRLVLDDGTELAAGPAMIAAELGSRGPFEGELSFSVSGERNALLQVYSSSARDGGITHLASVGVTLAPDGPANLIPAEPHPEAIQIVRPEPGATISGGTVQVEGTGLASFEGTLIVEIYDAEGVMLASEPLIVEAPDIGLPGRFSLTLTYAVSAEGPGRVVVVDPLPAFDGLGHIASVEVTLAP